MNPTPLRELAARVRTGEMAADSLTKDAVAQIGRRNGRLNALISQRTAAALTDAAKLDVADHELAGIPFTAKDMLATADLPTTCGSKTLQGWHAGTDATAVARMRAAGAILMGKSNCPEFALGVDTNNELFGRTFNPLGAWTPGGSSGGEGSAVAAGMSLVGVGSDYGGSIRWPAQCTGLIGLRPSVGRVSRAGEQPTPPGADPLHVDTHSFQAAVQVIGPLARCVDDINTVLSVISGPDGIDPAAVEEDLGDYRDLRPSEIEVRWGIQIGAAAVDAEVAAAVLLAVKALKATGARVREGLPDAVCDALPVYDRLRAAEPMGAISALDVAGPGLIGGPIKAMLANRVKLDRAERASLWAERRRLIARLRRWLSGERVLVLPVSLDIPRDLGGNIDHFDLLAPSRAVSLFGVPALSVPVSTARSGAPISVQIVAPAFREDVTLAVGAALEQAAAPRLPPAPHDGSPDAR